MFFLSRIVLIEKSIRMTDKIFFFKHKQTTLFKKKKKRYKNLCRRKRKLQYYCFCKGFIGIRILLAADLNRPAQVYLLINTVPRWFSICFITLSTKNIKTNFFFFCNIVNLFSNIDIVYYTYL